MPVSLVNFCGVLLVMALLAACGEETPTIPEGFHRLGGEGADHFVHVTDEEVFGDKVNQRLAGKKICQMYNHIDYCVVHFWKDRDQVAHSLPIHREVGAYGRYSVSNGTVKLKVLK